MLLVVETAFATLLTMWPSVPVSVYIMEPIVQVKKHMTIIENRANNVCLFYSDIKLTGKPTPICSSNEKNEKKMKKNMTENEMIFYDKKIMYSFCHQNIFKIMFISFLEYLDCMYYKHSGELPNFPSVKKNMLKIAMIKVRNLYYK